MKTFFQAIRIHQWVKNVLIFIPIILAHEYYKKELWLICLYTFLSLSCLASALYLLNDIIDLKADRLHKTKRMRPLARGAISIQQAIFMMTVLTFCSLSIMYFNHLDLRILSIYAFLSITYSLFFKKVFLLDVIILAILYSLRIIFGLWVSELPFSFWIISFSFFMFLSLAFLKRFVELNELKEQREKTPGRGYIKADIHMIQIQGLCSGYISIIMFVFYIQSERSLSLYNHSIYLWTILPALVFWIGNLWHLAHQRLVDSDPILFVLKNKTSYIIGFFILFIILIAK